MPMPKMNQARNCSHKSIRIDYTAEGAVVYEAMPFTCYTKPSSYFDRHGDCQQQLSHYYQNDLDLMMG